MRSYQSVQRKAFHNIWHPFMMKTLCKPEIEENFPILIESIYKRPMANNILNGERLNGFSMRLRWGFPLPTLPFNIVFPEVLARIIKQIKEIKGIQGEIKACLFADDMII